MNAPSIERIELGAVLNARGAKICVWAPNVRELDVVIEADNRITALKKDAQGYFRGFVPDVRAGARYKYRLDHQHLFPDPTSRFQPEGPHGPSVVVDPDAFQWSDRAWQGIKMKGQVIYELHVGAFTAEGTFDAAIGQLAELKSLGITVIELLPLAEFPGRWNWGYDGVALYAPFHGYGDYEALKRFVDAAHGVGIAVILDVVYNHLGPDGNYLAHYSKAYFTDRYQNDWGQALNFDGEHSQPVRDFFTHNAAYWVSEFHLDGLRLDATQSIHDSSDAHIIGAITQAARAAARPRDIILVAENEPQLIDCLMPIERQGYGLDAMWNDDFHHSARVALTGRREGYFHDHRGHAQEFISCVKRGFLFQGQYYDWQKQPRGTPVTDQPAWAFVTFTQNHDQVGNTFYGERIDRLASASRIRAMTGLQLLTPGTPMLFMGQEFSASTPFPFFADHDPELARQVLDGRRKFMRQFPSYASAAAQSRLLDPSLAETFQLAKLDFHERESHAPIYRLHRDLLRVRREDPLIAAQDRHRIEGAVLGEHAFVLRYFGESEDRLLVVNLGAELWLATAPEPLLAPRRGESWSLAWSSDDPSYAGPGVVNPCADRGWRIPGESTCLLSSARA